MESTSQPFSETYSRLLLLDGQGPGRTQGEVVLRQIGRQMLPLCTPWEIQLRVCDAGHLLSGTAP
jgi:hypothetical protein